MFNCLTDYSTESNNKFVFCCFLMNNCSNDYLGSKNIDSLLLHADWDKYKMKTGSGLTLECHLH